jgi:hypothetical protein
MPKNRIANLLKILISLGLLALLSRLIDWNQAWASLRGMSLPLFVGAFLLFQTTLLIRSYRWRALLDALGTRVPILRLLYLYYAGAFFNTFLPSGFGGDAVKMYELAHYSRRPSEAIGTVLVDRLAGIVVSLAMGVLAWPFAYRAVQPREAIFVLVISCGGLLGAWLLFRRSLADRVLHYAPNKVRSWMERLYNAVHTCGTQALRKALAISVLFNLVLFAMNYAIALALGQQIPFAYFVAFMPIISLSMLIPSVGALGTREGAYVLLFGAAGVPGHVAIAMSLAFYLVNVLTGIIGAALYATAALTGLGARPITKESDGPVDRRPGL